MPDLLECNPQRLSSKYHFLSQIVWRPYGAADEIIMRLPEYCRAGRAVWMARSPLICIELVEWHLPDRVLRQFGCVQTIPHHPDTDRELHRMTRRGRPGEDWESRLRSNKEMYYK
ncbi:hypothetical protein U1Q18_052405 [Sarracenia purpurea var. burkii]